MNEPTTRSLDELLGSEMYVYQGKTYPRKHLYKTSSLKTMFIAVYLILMVVVIAGVAAWSLGVSFTLPNFLLGVDDSPTVQVRERNVVPPVTPAAVATTTDSEGQVQATVEVIDGVSTSTATMTTSSESVQTTAEVLPATSTTKTATSTTL